MQIFHINFEEVLLLEINNQLIRIIPFRTTEPGNIKFGIDAPRSINVHREEIYIAIKLKEKQSVTK